MKIADRTPFRTENGQIDFMGRMQGTLKYGPSWYARLQAQSAVIAILDKVLGANYVLLRNVTLPNTDIDLPMVLIGPPGIYLINVTHERGVYRAKEDEWGAISSEKFVPAGINMIQRTKKLGQVLQIYLDRAGYKGTLFIEPILMAADPGMHIESVHPAVRVVMNDALERFAISMTQASVILSAEAIGNIAYAIVNGPRDENTSPAGALPSASALSREQMPASTEDSFSDEQQPSSQNSLGDTLEFSFDDDPSRLSETLETRDNAPVQAGQATMYDFSDQDETSQPETQTTISNKTPAPKVKQKKFLGLKRSQLIILSSILLIWLCGMALFAVFVFNALNV